MNRRSALDKGAKVNAKNINDLRKKLITNGTIKEWSSIEVLSGESTGNRYIGEMFLADIEPQYEGRIEPPFPPIRYLAHDLYVLWMPLTDKYVRRVIFVNPKTGRLDDGHYLTDPMHDNNSPFCLLRQ